MSRVWCVFSFIALAVVPLNAQTPFERLFEPRTAVSIILEMPEATWGPIAAEPPQGGICNFQFTGNRYNWHNANITVVTERDTVISQQLYTNAGIKKKSFCGSLHNFKPSLTIDLAQFNNANEALAEAHIGTKHLSLENALQPLVDPNLFRQCAGYYTFRSMGLPAPMCSFAALYRRDPNTPAVFIGIYVLTERVKKDFFRRRPAIDMVPNAGSLYELEVGDDFTPPTLGQLQVEWSATSSQDFAFAVNQFQNFTATTLGKTIDLPSFIDFWATEIFLKHFDGLTGNTNNTFAFDDAPSPIQKTRFRLIPHGVDQILKLTDKPVVYQQSIVAQRAYANNGLRYQLHRVLAEYGNRIAAADVQGAVESYVPTVLHLWRGNDLILGSDSNVARKMAEKVKVEVNQAIVDVQSVFGEGLLTPTFTPKRIECPFFVQCLTSDTSNPELGRAWCTTQANQQWVFESLPQSMGSLGFPDPLKLYAVRNAGTQACLQVGAQFPDGSNRWTLQMAACSATNASQHFFLVRREGRGFELRSFVRNGCAHFSGSAVTTDGRPAVYIGQCDNDSKKLLVAEP